MDATIKSPHSQISTSGSDRESKQTASPSHNHNHLTSVVQDGVSSKDRNRPSRPSADESRETVKSEAFQITGWKIIDDSDEIYESCETGNAGYPPLSLNPLTNFSYSDLDVKPSVAELEETLAENEPPSSSNQKKSVPRHSPTVLDLTPASPEQSLSKRPLPSSPEPKKKRRLIPTKKAVEIANQKFKKYGGMEDYLHSQPAAPRIRPSTYNQEEFGFVNPFPDGFPLSDEEGSLCADPHPDSSLYQDSDHEDHGYWSKMVSPADCGGGESPEEQQVHLKEVLSRSRQYKQTRPESNPESSNTKMDEEQKLMILAREHMHKSEEAGAERSRQLREKALLQRGLLPIPEGDSASERSRTLSNAGTDNSSDNGLFSVNNGQGDYIQDLLDVAQVHVMKSSRPAQTEVRDKLKANGHPKGHIAHNLVSRAAAEQFRTQSRHLGGHCDTQIDNNGAVPFPLRNGHHVGSKSECTNLQATEERLREAKKPGLLRATDEGRVSGASPNNQFITDDEINPRAQRNRLPVVPSRHKRSLGVDTEQQAIQLSAGVRNEVNLSLPIRPPSDSEIQTANRDAAIDQNDPQNSLSLPLSGLERLAAKRGAVNYCKSTSRSPDRPLLGGQRLAAQRGLSPIDSRRTESQSEQDNVRRSSWSVTAGPNKGLTLPKNFDQLSEEEREVIVQHEIAKERKRDLDALGSVFWTFAQLQCFRDREMTDRNIQFETNELHDIGRFIALVIEQGKPGKMRRTRIQDIRDNIRRRVFKAAESSEEPSDVAILTEMRRTFSQKHIDFINDETPKVQAEIEKWGSLRSERGSKRHSMRLRERKKKERPKERMEKPSKKQVRFADEVVRAAQSRRPKSEASRIESRQAQSNKQEEIIEKLRAQLKLFETAGADEVAELQSQVAEIEAELERATQRYDDDESEEEDGAEFVFGAGQDAASSLSQGAHSQTTQDKITAEEQDIREINRLENERQKESRGRAPAPNQQRPDPGLLKQMQLKMSQPSRSQAFDPELLRQIQLKKNQQLEAASDSTIIDRAAAGESDSEADTSDEDEDEDAVEEDRQVFRYTVWGAFAGVDIYKDADHYYFMKTYNATEAQDKVRQIISSIHRYAASEENDTESSRVNVQTQLQDELMMQHIIVGEDSTIEARVWIERDLVDLKTKAFRAAKRQRAVKQVATWAVYWEKTITPVINAAEETETEAATADPDGFDDLFEESAEDKGPAAATATAAPAAAPVTTSSVAQDEIKLFTTPILANRWAKDVYLAWHFTFLPGWQNEGYRRLEDESMEQYLETLGDWGLFVREESFERVEVDDTDGGGGGGGGPGRRVEEKFKVWVKKIAVKGPGN